MKNDDKLQALFVEINKKPKDLDQNIMQKIYRQVELEKSVEESKPKSWIWTYVLIAIISIGGLGYIVTLIDFEKDSLIWLIALAALIPILIEKLIQFNKHPKTAY